MKIKEENIITIEEEVRIPDTDIILEKGDKIRVIENYDGDEDKADAKKNDEADDEKDDEKDDEVEEKKKK